MFPAGGVCMKMNRLLISSSMIAAMCEKSATDNLKLLEPFVIVCLSDLFVPGEQIKKFIGNVLISAMLKISPKTNQKLTNGKRFLKPLVLIKSRPPLKGVA